MSPIETAEEATRRAEAFIGRYHAYKRLISVHRQPDSWLLVYDVSILGPKDRVEIILDASTGDVTGYGPVEQ